MTIVFEALSHVETHAAVIHQLRLRALSYPLSGVHSRHRLRLRSLGETSVYADPPTPSTIVYGSHSLSLSATATVSTRTFVEGGVLLSLGARGFGGIAGAAHGRHWLQLRAFGHAVTGGTTGHALLVARPFEVSGYGSVLFVEVEPSQLVVNTEVTGLLDYVVQSVLRMSDAPSVFVRFVVAIESSMTLRESLALLIDAGVESTIDLEDPVEADLRMIASIVDLLQVDDEPTSLLSLLQTVVSALVLADAFIPIADGGEIASEALLTEELAARIDALVEAVSELQLTEELSPTLHMVGFIESEVALTDDPDALLVLLADLLDTASFAVRFDNGQERFSGYTVNLRTAAVTEYENYDFNSLTLIGGKAYGAREDGIYRLDGDTDNGDPIEAYVRTGVLNLDSLSHVVKAWIGLTSDGQMVLKTVTTDNGSKKEHWYTMAARPQGAPVDSRFNPAKGVTGMYWQWELANVDGSYFELDMLKVWPISIGRRYSGR